MGEVGWGTAPIGAWFWTGEGVAWTHKANVRESVVMGVDGGSMAFISSGKKP